MVKCVRWMRLSRILPNNDDGDVANFLKCLIGLFFLVQFIAPQVSESDGTVVYLNVYV